MLPLLRCASDGEEHKLSEAVAQLSNDLQLTEEDRAVLLPSGSQTLIHNRIAWASTYMRKAGLLESTRRGHFRITGRGKQVLEAGPSEINVSFLKRYPEFMTFHDSGRNSTAEQTAAVATDASEGETVTPEESLETAVQRLRAELATEVIARVMSCSPEFFERLVVTLLLNMGYGGSRADAGRAIGRSGDGGIDGRRHTFLFLIFPSQRRTKSFASRHPARRCVSGASATRSSAWRPSSWSVTSILFRPAEDWKDLLPSRKCTKQPK